MKRYFLDRKFDWYVRSSGNRDFEVTMITAGIPTIFEKVKISIIWEQNYKGDINSDKRLWNVWNHSWPMEVKMGLISSVEEAVGRQHTRR